MSRSRTVLGMVFVAGCIGAHAQAPVGDLTAVDASVQGAVTLTASGMRVMNGSSIAAGASPAVLRLSRGGELRVCPHASLSITSSANSSQLMLAMNTGAIETHYRLASTRDTIVTPDFRIMLIGPGEFHVAIAADARGNTCVRTLERNTAAVVIEEQLGEGVRQLGMKEQAVFRNGSVKDPDPLLSPECGCAAPAAELAAQPRPIPLLEDVPAPAAAPDAHVLVDVPFVFNADPAVPPPPLTAHLKLSDVPVLFRTVRVVPPPVRRGLWGRMRSWLGRVF